MRYFLPNFSLGGVVFLMLCILAGSYFVFNAVQGEYGVLRQAEVRAEVAELTAERDRLYAELGRMTNLTHRMSDDFLDMDLLDQQVRDVLGYVRADEVVLN